MADLTSRRQRRRAAMPDRRQVDRERTRAALLEAALEEFSEKGFAGTTVRDIAARAGVSKDLIAYHFGSKDGLYRAVQATWLDRESTLSDPELPFDQLLVRYLHDALADPRLLRLLIWRGLAGGPDTGTGSHSGDDSLVLTVRRQQRGELPPDIDVGTLRLVLLAAVAAPVAFPDMAQQLLGVRPDDPAFEERYTEGLRTLITRLTS